jgi:hypothetical protein
MMRVIELVDHPGYRINELGVIESDVIPGSKKRRRSGIWREIKPTINKRWGYAYVDLRSGVRRNARVNVLMLETFIGPAPPGMECRHKDGNRLNNRLDNLCYGTRSDNMMDASRHGTIYRGGSKKRVVE